MRRGVVLIGLLRVCNVLAQSPPAPLTFEVASIKLSASDVQGVFLQPRPNGDIRITGATLKNLIAFAFNVREFAIAGAPAWASSDRFDIDARVGESPGTPQQIRERLKSLLADRFQLAVHPERKEQSVYALLVAKSGPKLRSAEPDARSMIRKRGESIAGEGVGMQMLALNLANSLDRPVLDQTGLTGKYDFRLEWSPDADRAPAAVTAGSPSAPDPTGPTLFTALQEQLGLRLEARRVPTEILVIDEVARPSEN